MASYFIQHPGKAVPTFPHPTMWPKEFLAQMDARFIPPAKAMIEEEDILTELSYDLMGKSMAERKNIWIHFPQRAKPTRGDHPLIEAFIRAEIDELHQYSSDDFRELGLPLTPDILKLSPTVALWMELNRGASDPMIGLKKTHWYFPAYTDGAKGVLEIRLPVVQAIRRIAKFAAMESYLDLAEGKPARAWQRMTGVWRAGRGKVQGRKFIITWLVGVAVEELAMTTLESCLRAGQFSAEDLRTLQAEIAALQPLPTPEEIILHGERFTLLDIIQRVAINKISAMKSDSRVIVEIGIDVQDCSDIALEDLSEEEKQKRVCEVVDIDWVLRFANQHYLAMAKAYQSGNVLECESLKKRLARPAKPVPSTTLAAKRAARTKRFAKALLRILVPSVARAWEIGRNATAHQQLLEVAIAVELYRKQNGGKLPAMLEVGLGERAKALMTPPKNSRFRGGMRLSVLGDKNKPDAYALWFPLTKEYCLRWEDAHSSEFTQAELDAPGNDPAKTKLQDCQRGRFVLYILISAKAKAEWKAMQLKKLRKAEEALGE